MKKNLLYKNEMPQVVKVLITLFAFIAFNFNAFAANYTITIDDASTATIVPGTTEEIIKITVSHPQSGGIKRYFAN